MKFLLQFSPLVYFTLTKDQFEIIFDAAKYHYDDEIKLSTMEKGWLSEMRYAFTSHDRNPAELKWEIWQIDQVTKALEMSRVDGATEISQKLFEAFTIANQYKREINQPLAEKEF